MDHTNIKLEIAKIQQSLINLKELIANSYTNSMTNGNQIILDAAIANTNNAIHDLKLTDALNDYLSDEFEKLYGS